MEHEQHFLETMQQVSPEVVDLTDAIYFARMQVPKVDYDKFLGDINGEGTFYSDDKRSSWHPNETVEMVALQIASEML